MLVGTTKGRSAAATNPCVTKTLVQCLNAANSPIAVSDTNVEDGSGICHTVNHVGVTTECWNLATNTKAVVTTKLVKYTEAGNPMNARCVDLTRNPFSVASLVTLNATVAKLKVSITKMAAAALVGAAKAKKALTGL